jgi:ABC-type polysaccharide/polyol phosphate export permease
MFWAILIPIIPMTAYMMLAFIKAFNSSTNMPYIFYIALGITLWMFMSKVMRESMMAIKNEKVILTKTNYPIIAVVFSKIGEVLADTIIRIIAVISIMIWYHIYPDPISLILVCLLLIPIFFFALSIGLILSIIDTIIPDTRRLFDISMRYGLFLSSVIFPFPTEGILGYINQFNLFNTYINAFRDLIYHGEIFNVSLLLYTILFTILSTLLAAKITYYMNYRIRAYI